MKTRRVEGNIGGRTRVDGDDDDDGWHTVRAAPGQGEVVMVTAREGLERVAALLSSAG